MPHKENKRNVYMSGFNITLMSETEADEGTNYRCQSQMRDASTQRENVSLVKYKCHKKC